MLGVGRIRGQVATGGQHASQLQAERRPSGETLENLQDLADVSIREVSKYFETLPPTLDPTGNNPLVWAAEKGQAQVAGFLLEEGVDVNHRGYMGNHRGHSSGACRSRRTRGVSTRAAWLPRHQPQHRGIP